MSKTKNKGGVRLPERKLRPILQIITKEETKNLSKLQGMIVHPAGASIF